MSLERVFKRLEDFGLSRTESEVYIYLAKAGPSRAKDLGTGLKITSQQLYPALKRLKKKGIVSTKPERTALFTAIAFEELLDLFMRISAEKAKAVKETRQELVNSWQDLVKQSNNS